MRNAHNIDVECKDVLCTILTKLTSLTGLTCGSIILLYCE